MLTNFFFKILLVLSFLLNTAFAAESFNPINCARQVLPPISSLSVDAKYALFEKRILISLKNITIEAYPRDKDIFDPTGNPQIAPQADKLPCAKDWQQRLFHRYQLNIWNENYAEKITITVLLTMEFANPHDRDLFMNNLRIALSRSFTYEDLKKFVHESTVTESFALRFQFLPEGISENLQSSYLKHAQVSLRKLEISHKDGDSSLVSTRSNAVEIILNEEYRNGAVPTVAQFFHWLINLRAFKNIYDDQKLNKNFFSRQKFKNYKEETINQLLQDFSSALATARETVLNNLSSIDIRHLPSSRSEKSFLEMDSGKFIYPEAYLDSRLNDQQQVQHFLYWINPENPESIEYIPVEFGGIIPTNYEEGYWRNYVARLLVTIIPAKERNKLGKIVIVVKNDLEEIVPKVTPLPGSENKFAITIEIPPTAKLNNRKVGVKNLIHSLGNLTHDNQADFGMHLAVSFIKVFECRSIMTDYSLVNVREHLSLIDEIIDFNPNRFIDYYAPLAFSILSDNPNIKSNRGVSFFEKNGSNESKFRYKNNRQWLEFYLRGFSKQIKIGVDMAVLPIQSPQIGLGLANQQDQDVLKEFYEIVQKVLAPFLRVDIAPLLLSSIKFISHPEPLPEIKNIQKFTKKIGVRSQYYDEEIFRSTNRGVLVSWRTDKEGSPTIIVVLAKKENLLADPPTMVKHLQSAVLHTIIDGIFAGPSRDEADPTKDSIFSDIADRDILRDAFWWVLPRIFFPETDKFDTDPVIRPDMETQRFVWRYLETVRHMAQSSTRAEIEEIIAFIKNYLRDDFEQSPLLQGARDYNDNPQSYYFTRDLETLKDQLQEFIWERIYNLSLKGNKGDSSKLSKITQEVKNVKAELFKGSNPKGDLKNIIQELINSPESLKLSSDTQGFIRAYMRNVRNSSKNNFQGLLLQRVLKRVTGMTRYQRPNVSPLITIKDGQITFNIHWDSNQESFKITLPYDENQDINQTIREIFLPILARLNNKTHNFPEILKGNKELIFIYPDDQRLSKVGDQILLTVGSESCKMTDQKQGKGRFSLLAGNSADGQRLFIVLPREKSSELTIGDTTIKGYWNSSSKGDPLLAQIIQAYFGKRDQIAQDKLGE